MLNVTFVIILVIIAIFGGCAAGVFAVLHSIRKHQIDGVLYVDDSVEEPAIYTTLNDNISSFKNGQFKLLLVRRIYNAESCVRRITTNKPQK